MDDTFFCRCFSGIVINNFVSVDIVIYPFSVREIGGQSSKFCNIGLLYDECELRNQHSIRLRQIIGGEMKNLNTENYIFA